jgi:hypothetical protein
MHLGVAANVAASSLTVLAFAGANIEPGPLRGVPLEGKTGLRLVVSYGTPVFLDVDTLRVTRVRGAPAGRVAYVVGVHGRAVVIADPFARRGRVYALRGWDLSLSPLGPGSEVVSASDGRSVWIKRIVRPSHCTLRKAGIDGRLLRAPKEFPCSKGIYSGGLLGLGVSSTRIIDPVTRRAVFTTRSGIVAVAGKKVVLTNGPGRQFAVVDTATGTENRFAWPDTPGSLGQAAVDVQGRFVALEFGNPSWTGPGGQAWDVWLLDTRTAKVTHVPDLPAFVWLKWTTMDWTADGRLVLVTRNDDRQVVAVWRPGQARLHLKTVRIPNRSAAVRTFAILR